MFYGCDECGNLNIIDAMKQNMQTTALFSLRQKHLSLNLNQGDNSIIYFIFTGYLAVSRSLNKFS